MSTEIPVKVSVRDGTITIQLPLESIHGQSRRKRPPQRRPDWSILKSTRGMWRHRRVDGLEYQRETRREWNRCPAR